MDVLRLRCDCGEGVTKDVLFHGDNMKDSLTIFELELRMVARRRAA
jgi:hypothetical protein